MDELTQAVQGLIARFNALKAENQTLKDQLAAAPTADALKAITDQANAAQ
jgi:regulator of replication initiation timing